jgi:hypothetical protein
VNARDELAEIQDSHWVTGNINLGQYRTKFICACDAEWVHDGHDPKQRDGSFLFAQHVADWIIKAGYRKQRS